METIVGVLFEHMCFIIVQDLERLNRDLSRVVVLDRDRLHVVAPHSDNVVVVGKFDGDFEKDAALFKHIPFLESTFAIFCL